MGIQRNNPQMKEKKESPDKRLNEIEARNLSDTEFKEMVIRMLKKLNENYKELSGNFIIMKKYIETMNKNELEMKNAISEMNTLERIKSRLTEAEDWISNWKTR